jgi:hypothetical protein
MAVQAFAGFIEEETLWAETVIKESLKLRSERTDVTVQKVSVRPTIFGRHAFYPDGVRLVGPMPLRISTHTQARQPAYAHAMRAHLGGICKLL